MTAFDLQAHRGGAGLAPENSLAAFATALDLGVTTLECDVHVSLDGVPVLSHERTYAGRVIPRLTWAELRDLRGGPEPLATLGDLVALVQERRAQVDLNVETKFDVLHPTEEAPRECFVAAIVDLVREADLLARCSVQSFDWLVLRMVRDAEPRLRLNALTNTDQLEIDQPGASPWLAGLDIDDFHDSVPAAVHHLGFDAISPSHSILTASMVSEAHAVGLRVLPWTVDDEATMRHLVGTGSGTGAEVDGLITNRPDVLRGVLASLGLPLPPAFPRLA